VEVPPFAERESHSQREREREPFAREAIHKLGREKRREIVHEKDRSA
jgi:hypothetical protein